MDQSNTPSLRRSEDIALDLLKFLASHANIKSTPASTTPGFGAATSPKSDETITQLLELYARCRKAVETPVATK